MRRLLLIATTLLAFSQTALGLDIEEDAVFVRVIDVGAGLATVTRMPGDYYMVYDSGYWAGQGSRAFQGISEVIPEGEEIDLLVLSHSDADHQGAVKRILNQNTVKKILRGGLERLDSGTWVRANEAIIAERTDENAVEINLKHAEFPPGATYRFGDTFITMVSGFYAPPTMEPAFLNSDPSGPPFIDDPGDALIASEKFMVENASVIKIDSDVLLAPHHGADNGSSNAFIEAVSPQWVIFSAGHKHGHPRTAAVERYLASGVPLENLFRTDLGDDETEEWGTEEWGHGRISGQADPSGDDDVDILIRPTGEILVEYRN